jgi:hypothetical protein
MSRLALGLAVAALASPALPESPRSGSFQFQLTSYRPNIDAEFGGAARPYEDTFGSGRTLTIQGLLSRSVYMGYGSVDVGFGAGYWMRRGYGVVAATGEVSGDRTRLQIVPLSLSVTYRMDYFVDKRGIPLAPYVRLGYEHWLWSVTNGANQTAKSLDGKTGSGSAIGWSAALGLALLLDFVDPGLAREMDRDTGVNHTYVFFEATRLQVDDFGSKKSWDLSNDQTVAFSGGLLFVF